MNKIYNKINFYKAEYEKGHYHNPYDVDEELEKLIPDNITEEQKIELEDLIHKTGLLFWDM